MANTNELEKRLRAALIPNDAAWPNRDAIRFGWDEVVAAARIGAEIEREACAQLAEADRLHFASALEPDCARVAAGIKHAIRARGGK